MSTSTENVGGANLGEWQRQTHTDDEKHPASVADTQRGHIPSKRYEHERLCATTMTVTV